MSFYILHIFYPPNDQNKEKYYYTHWEIFSSLDQVKDYMWRIRWVDKGGWIKEIDSISLNTIWTQREFNWVFKIQQVEYSFENERIFREGLEEEK